MEQNVTFKDAGDTKGITVSVKLCDLAGMHSARSAE